MKLDTFHFLLIDKGDPYTKGDRLQLNSKDTLIGRSCNTDRPDIAFDSLYVSRKHAVVTWDGDSLVIRDLGSKHGTQINGIEIKPDHPAAISNGDQINLAKGMVTMTYKLNTDFDDRTITMTNVFPRTPEALAIDIDRREVRLEGVLLNFFGKERDLLLMLYRNRNKAVSYDEIKTELWPERQPNDTVPDVGNEEINALVYRLRKRLGKHGQKIITIARFGVLLES